MRCSSLIVHVRLHTHTVICCTHTCTPNVLRVHTNTHSNTACTRTVICWHLVKITINDVKLRCHSETDTTTDCRGATRTDDSVWYNDGTIWWRREWTDHSGVNCYETHTKQTWHSWERNSQCCEKACSWYCRFALLWPSLFKVCDETLNVCPLAVRLLVTRPGVWGGGEGSVLFDTLQQDQWKGMEKEMSDNFATSRTLVWGCLVPLTDLEETLHILQNKHSTVRRIVL